MFRRGAGEQRVETRADFFLFFVEFPFFLDLAREEPVRILSIVRMLAVLL